MDRCGGIDVVVNNAGALDLRSTRDIDVKKYDLWPRTTIIDEDVLAQGGATDLDGYRAVPGSGRRDADLFLDPLPSDA